MQNLATKLDGAAIEAIEAGLHQAVAETVVTTMKAQNYHWNVTGMAFGPLHDMFQKIYEDHFEAQDDLSERLRALGCHAEGRLSVHIDRSKITESDGKIPAETMIEILADDQEILASTLAALADLADKNGDALTQDIAISRGRTHEKFAWMLRAHLGR
ncbi:MAG: DNA starvation/stationary phase protection protein [Pseudomonadota bacterium]